MSSLIETSSSNKMEKGGCRGKIRCTAQNMVAIMKRILSMAFNLNLKMKTNKLIFSNNASRTMMKKSLGLQNRMLRRRTNSNNIAWMDD